MDISFFDPNRTANASAWRVLPNRWDVVAFPLIIGILAMAIVGFHQTMAPIGVLQTQKISLDPSNLPEYALRTTLRMLAAMVASLVHADLRHARREKPRAGMVLIPILDILKSVPVLGFISFTVTFFLALFPARARCGAGAIFAIFTSQAWNMTFSFYQSLRTVPRDLSEVSRGFHLTSVAALLEARSAVLDAGADLEHDDVDVGRLVLRRRVGGHHRRQPDHTLPGVGAYLAQAISGQELGAVG